MPTPAKSFSSLTSLPRLPCVPYLPVIIAFKARKANIDRQYRVLPISKQALTEGFETLHDPANLHASPKGWNYNGTAATNDTSGNNAIAYKNSDTGTTKQSSSGQNFIFTQDPTAAPSTADNVAAAVTNAFYIVNSVHDISYLYGFTEAAYNFQNDNFGKGGADGDAVRVSVQYAQGLDNAFFTTPPDGQPGQMAMFLWDATRPERDGALENDVPVHENTHGISNRMTGGGTARCLQTEESAGMGEGWSDAMAEWTEQKDAEVRDFVVGPYVANNPAGIRSYPYSTNAYVFLLERIWWGAVGADAGSWMCLGRPTLCATRACRPALRSMVSCAPASAIFLG